MKKFVLAFAIALMIISACSCSLSKAETLSIDLDTATYEELVSAYEVIENTIIEKLKEQNEEPKHASTPLDGISFRDVPWGCSKNEAEAIIGIGGCSSYYIPTKDGSVYTNGIGVQMYYKNWTLAGIPVNRVYVNYVYPTVNGVLIRDENTAVFYLAEYVLSDIADTTALVEDFTSKLSLLYGAYSLENRDSRTWVDASNNEIQLKYSSSRISLIYSSSQTDELLENAYQAAIKEQREQEELLRLENQNNTDGL